VMRLRGDDETVSALAPVVETEETNGDAEAAAEPPPEDAVEPLVEPPTAE
jgi:hypothetical protein